jgi:hypothetical protein
MSKNNIMMVLMGNIISFLCLLALSNYFIPNAELIESNSFSSEWAIGVFISLLPIGILVGIGFVYILSGISNKYRKVQPYIYIHVATLVSAIIIILGLSIIMQYINVVTLNVIIALLFLFSIIMQAISLIGLKKHNFDISYEFDMLKRIGEIYDAEITQIKTLKKKINKAFYIYFILYVISPPIYIYIIILLSGTVYVTPYLVKMKKEYAKFDYITNKKSSRLLINYYICCALSIPAYLINPFLALIVFYSGDIVRFLLDNEYSRNNYSDIEERYHLLSGTHDDEEIDFEL